MNETLFKEGLFRRCVGDRETTRNTFDIKPGEIVLVRRGLSDRETELIVSLCSQMTESGCERIAFPESEMFGDPQFLKNNLQ